MVTGQDKGREALLLEDVTCMPFAPMIYVAWADGELTGDEIAQIRGQLGRVKLSEGGKQAVDAWLDPAKPPTATELLRLLRGVRKAVAKMPGTGRRSLAALGEALAGEGVDAGTRRALEEVEQALGLGWGAHSAALFEAKDDAGAPLVEPWSALEAQPAFDVAAMGALLDGRYAKVRAKLRDKLTAPMFRYKDELPKAEQRELVLSWLKELSAEGYGAKAFPAVLKQSEDMGEFVACFETLGHGDLSLAVKFGVQFGLFGGSIYALGTERHHALLADVASLKLLGCFAMSELGHGSNVRDIETTATFDPAADQWVIHTPNEYARKEWIGNAALHGHMATVFAQLVTGEDCHGVHAFLVPIRDEAGQLMPGVHIEDCGHKMGLNGVDNGRLWFDGVRIPRTNLLNKFADVDAQGVYTSPIASPSKRFFTMLGTLVGGRVSVGGMGLSASKNALTIAIRYAAMRRQFGPADGREVTLLTFRTHQRRLMPLLADAYALTFAQQYVVNRFLGRSEADEREVEALAAGLKSVATWHATHTIQTARECCGGQGYLSINRFPALKADSDIFTTFEGDNTVLMQLVAKSLLTDYKQQFSNFSFMNAMRFLAGRADTALSKLDPLTSRRTDGAHLRSAAFQLELIRLRERSLVASVARRLKSRLDDKKDPFDAMIEVQDHLMAAAHAHMDRVILEQFVEACGRAGDAERAQLDRLRALHGLHHIERELGWYMENGLIEAPKARAIRAEVNALCEEVRHQAVALTSAFLIPEELLAAPIATSPIIEPRQG
jgi:acyl-CoA oxidase